jgi:hypothetical protein
LNWFEENEFIGNSVDDGDGDSNQSSDGNYYFEDSEHFAMQCTPTSPEEFPSGDLKDLIGVLVSPVKSVENESNVKERTSGGL